MCDARWSDPREYDARDRSDEWPRVYDTRDRDDYDARDGLMRDLDLPRGDERELVVDRDRVYEIDGEDSRALAAVGAFRIVPEQDLDLPRETLENLHDQRLVEVVTEAPRWCVGVGRGLRITGSGAGCNLPRTQERDALIAAMYTAKSADQSEAARVSGRGLPTGRV